MAGPQDTHEPGAACRIVVVDDHAIMRDGLTALLTEEPDFEIVGTAEDGRAAIGEVEERQPDVVLMDLSMPRTDGAQAVSILKRRHPGVRVVVLTLHRDDNHIHAALEAGADAYVLKDDGRGQLIAAIRNVWAGRQYLSPAISDRVISGYLRERPEPAAARTGSWDMLTPREREVLKLVAEGYRTREIAEYLSLSERTVEKHRVNMMRKLGLKGVSAVTAYAIDNGLLSQ